jgi:molybdopterin molybdotransferase
MKTFIGFDEALDLTLSRIALLDSERVPLARATGRILCEDHVAVVDSPSAHTSLKDGYGVLSKDLEGASEARPVRLRVTGKVTAGARGSSALSQGNAVRVTTGAAIPTGADAVLSEEFCRVDGEAVVCMGDARPGRNVLEKGTDVRRGETVGKKGQQLTPPLIGLLASSGLGEVEVYRRPRLTVIATGDEIVAPGAPLEEGKLYASNMMEILSWLSLFRIPAEAELARDLQRDILSAIREHMGEADAFISTGGIWGSERDLMIRVLSELEWQGVYHRVRMGPGKAVAFGLVEGKPFFCLPGGPPSNEMAFLQLALRGILAMTGHKDPPFPVVMARPTETLRGEKTWTQFIHGRLVKEGGEVWVRPDKPKSRLKSMARKEAVIKIPEGCEEVTEGVAVPVQILIPLVQAYDVFSKLGLSGWERG